VARQVKGAGFIKFEGGIAKGELERVTESSYFNYDKKRYTDCLENFKNGWHYYLSVLETDIIEMKLTMILNSLTFRYTR
jgi:hypothetical protein